MKTETEAEFLKRFDGMPGSEGVGRILRERARQYFEEEYDAAHDEQHKRGELAEAAKCYVQAAATQVQGYRPSWLVPEFWPWGVDAWKPSDDPVRNLEKAGALIAAQIDVILLGRERAALEKKTTEGPETAVGGRGDAAEQFVEWFKKAALNTMVDAESGWHKLRSLGLVTGASMRVVDPADVTHPDGVGTPLRSVEVTTDPAQGPMAAQTHVDKSRIFTIESEGLRYTVRVLAENTADLDEYPQTGEVIRMFRRLGNLEGCENVDPPGRGASREARREG